MTRLLFPDAFGMIAAGTALIVGLVLVSDFGVRTVIIQRKNGDDDQFLKSAWTFQVCRGIILWITLSGICGLLQLSSVQDLMPELSVYKNPQFSVVTTVLGLNIFLSSAESTAVSLNIRRLNFRPLFVVDLISKLLPVPIMIYWAYLSPNVWAIVGGILLGSLLRLILSHLIVPGPRMSVSYNPNHIKEIVSFGKWVNLSSLATFIGSQSDYIILGILLPGSSLGFYYLARTLKDAIENLLERLNSTMTLPVLSEVVRTDPSKVSDLYYRFRRPIEIVAATSGGFLFTSADLIVQFLYDSRYHDAGVMLRALSISLVLYPFLLIRSAFTAIGEAYITAWVSVVQAFSLVIGLIAGYALMGPIGGIASGVLSRMAPSLLILILARRKHWIVLIKELRSLPAFAIGLVMGQVATYFLGSYTLADLRMFLRL